ncbi:MAG: PorT family protein, partial [Prevotella sp.]|nr:PorT family protein [Prevotella sp.]
APGFAVKLGLQPAFCINNKIKGKSGSTSVQTDGIFDENTFELSMPIGLSYEFSNFVIEGRYNFGLTKAFKDMDNKNSVFQFTVGYKLPL